MKQKLSLVFKPMLIIMAMLSLYLFLYWGGGTLPGSNWTTIRDGLLPLWPWITVLAIALSVIFELN